MLRISLNGLILFFYLSRWGIFEEGKGLLKGGLNVLAKKFDFCTTPFK